MYDPVSDYGRRAIALDHARTMSRTVAGEASGLSFSYEEQFTPEEIVVAAGIFDEFLRTGR